MADTVEQRSAPSFNHQPQAQAKQQQAVPPSQAQPHSQKKTWPPARTGFRGKTVWRGLKLLSTLTIPIIVLVVTLNFTIQQDQANTAQHNFDQKIALDQQEPDLRQKMTIPTRT